MRLEVSPEEQTRQLEARINDARKIRKLSPNSPVTGAAFGIGAVRRREAAWTQAAAAREAALRLVIGRRAS
jgi:hypothetical protein